MSDLEVLGICICFGIIMGTMCMSVFAALGLVKIPRTKDDWEKLLKDWVEHTLYG